MKKIFSIISLLFFFTYQLSFNQIQKKIGENLKTKFENFEYENIISITDSILKSNSKISIDDSIQIFYFRALSAYHLSDINLSEKSFKTLVNLDKNFVLDSAEVSPKIIAFFEQIKQREIENSKKTSSKTDNENSLYSLKNLIAREREIYRESIWKNLIMPGWGNFVRNEKTKGYFFSLTFSASLISSIYFYLDANSKEKDYLNEINPDKISEKYSIYNKSFKIRNVSFIVLVLIYFYSQFDLLSRTYIPDFDALLNLNTYPSKSNIQHFYLNLNFPIY